ncbi:S26 family signal peptidase [Campylobacter lari]|nr:S26 family signal peptidase [Campylobacter lari]
MCYFFKIHFNTTFSMPLGIYKEVKNNMIAKNDIVIFTIPQKKEILLKKVIATKGDFVEVNASGVFINKIFIPNSTIFKVDSNNNPLEFSPIKHILKDNEIFVKGVHVKSYDSRYFGVVNIINNEVKKVIPVLIFNINT